MGSEVANEARAGSTDFITAGEVEHDDRGGWVADTFELCASLRGSSADCLPKFSSAGQGQ